ERSGVVADLPVGVAEASPGLEEAGILLGRLDEFLDSVFVLVFRFPLELRPLARVGFRGGFLLVLCGLLLVTGSVVEEADRLLLRREGVPPLLGRRHRSRRARRKADGGDEQRRRVDKLLHRDPPFRQPNRTLPRTC